jgi:Dyp-type peroxidase family
VKRASVRRAARLHRVGVPLSDAALRGYDTALRNLQGNILKGHGRDHSAYVLLEFGRGRQEQVRRWLASPRMRPTSMRQQLDEAAEYARYGVPGSLFRAILLTAEGYRYLRLAPDDRGFDTRFLGGMQASRGALDDPDVDRWDKPYRGSIHAMILLADDGATFIGRCAREIVNEVKDARIGTVVGVELGAALRNRDGDTIEHFGYADGRSQPLFLARDLAKERAREGVARFARWDPAAGPNLVLVADPFAGRDACGSYFVLRKLEQDVAGFKQREKDLAARIGLASPELAGALAMGRFATGNPVALSDRPELPATAARPRVVRNDFDYADDPGGARCPLYAHIRKVNPRGDSGARLALEKMHRVARRGVTYGPRTAESLVDESLMPSRGVGLLFMCFQADIGNQFEFIQRNWSNNASFPAARTGLDPVTGQGARSSQSWPRAWGEASAPARADFGGFVTMKGGAYFFAPSLEFFAGLAG